MAKKSDEQQQLKELNEQFTLAKQYLDPVHDRMNSQEELYRCYIDSDTYPHNARVFDPRIFRVIETVTPRMVATEPTGSFYPVESGDVTTNQILNTLFRYDWHRAVMFPKLVNFVKSLLLFGTAFGRNYWDFRECEKTQMVPKQLNGKMVWTPTNNKQVTYTEYDGPNFETLNIYDCYPDPNATNLDNMRWFIYRTFKTYDELMKENDARGGEYWKNLDKLKAAIDSKKSKDNTQKGYIPGDINYREHRRVMLSTTELHGQDKSNPEFVVLIRYDRKRWLFAVPEFGIVIRDVENPYFHGQLPIVYGVDYPYPGELYGMGEIEPLDRIQRAINAVLNQRLDNVQLTLNTMWKIKKNSGVDLHTLVSAPGNIITTEDMDAVDVIAVPDVTGSTFVQTMNYLTSSLQNGSAITDYTAGINDRTNTANQTATGVRLIQQEANAQFKLKIQLFNHMVIERIANQWKDLRIQYTTEKQKVRIVGRNDVKYMKEKTELGRIDLEGNPIIPGDYSTEAKMIVGNDDNFAFLTLLPEDIQPSIVGDYDFIASTSSEQLNDPIALQENFFVALDKMKDPAWVQGLAASGKKLNYAALTEKVFDKLNIGLDLNDVLEDYQPLQPTPEQVGTEGMGGPLGSQALNPDVIPQMDLQNLMEGGQNAGQNTGGTTEVIPGNVGTGGGL
jgi:hypothetical protein